MNTENISSGFVFPVDTSTPKNSSFEANQAAIQSYQKLVFPRQLREVKTYVEFKRSDDSMQSKSPESRHINLQSNTESKERTSVESEKSTRSKGQSPIERKIIKFFKEGQVSLSKLDPMVFRMRSSSNSSNKENSLRNKKKNFEESKERKSKNIAAEVEDEIDTTRGLSYNSLSFDDYERLIKKEEKAEAKVKLINESLNKLPACNKCQQDAEEYLFFVRSVIEDLILVQQRTLIDSHGYTPSYKQLMEEMEQEATEIRYKYETELKQLKERLQDSSERQRDWIVLRNLTAEQAVLLGEEIENSKRLAEEVEQLKNLVEEKDKQMATAQTIAESKSSFEADNIAHLNEKIKDILQQNLKEELEFEREKNSWTHTMRENNQLQNAKIEKLESEIKRMNEQGINDPGPVFKLFTLLENQLELQNLPEFKPLSTVYEKTKYFNDYFTRNPLQEPVKASPKSPMPQLVVKNSSGSENKEKNSLKENNGLPNMIEQPSPKKE